MTPAPHKQAITAAHVGCAAAAGYAAIKTAWGLGSTVGVRDSAVFDDFIRQIGGSLVAVWATVFLALLAGAILQSLVQPWGRRIPRRLRTSLAWLGFAIMTPVGLLGLAGTVAKAVGGQPDPMLTPATYIGVYTCFVVLGLSFAITAWQTRPNEAPAVRRSRRSSRLVPHFAHRQEDR
ncbi:MAG TPA: hypothetical protein VGV90_02410 [Solirubrobacteraceae bacterium]|nr:hypothetical protein [Solirubrobacteraceae bacterium]